MMRGRSSCLPALVLALSCLATSGSHAALFSEMHVFGDSLSDTGAAFLLLGGTPAPPTPMPPTVTATPIPSNSFIPSAPYVRPVGLPALSNGTVYPEWLAQRLGLPPPVPAIPPFFGNNWAVGGARVSPDPVSGLPNPLPNPPSTPNPFSLREQVNAFLGPPPVIPAPPTDDLFVVWGGGNDAREAVVAALPAAIAALSVDPTADVTPIVAPIVAPYIQAYAANLGDIVQDLVSLAGARNVLVVNVPDISLTPALQATAQSLGPLGPTALAQVSDLVDAFNTAYTGVMDALDAGLPVVDLNLVRFDVSTFLRDLVDGGTLNTSVACATDPACIADPSGHLFWDGIHPTQTGHTLIANALYAALVSAPGTLLLVAAATLLVMMRRRRTAAV